MNNYRLGLCNFLKVMILLIYYPCDAEQVNKYFIGFLLETKLTKFWVSEIRAICKVDIIIQDHLSQRKSAMGCVHVSHLLEADESKRLAMQRSILQCSSWRNRFNEDHAMWGHAWWNTGAGLVQSCSSGHRGGGGGAGDQAQVLQRKVEDGWAGAGGEWGERGHPWNMKTGGGELLRRGWPGT